MRVSDSQIWAGSILLSMLVYGLLFTQWSALPWPVNSLNQTTVITTKLRFDASETISVQAESELKQPASKKILRQVQESGHLPRKIIASKTVETKSQSEFESKIEKPLEVSKPATRTSADAALIMRQRDLYLVQLLEHIEKHKFYPASARRRGLSGKVNVRFSLNSDGQISSLVIDSQYSILKIAASEAIQSSLPMPVPTDNFTFPIQINFNMLYAIH